ncbi:MAG: 23S rRNA (uracil(1939)-C(5))-methyltransferase RlmD [Atribacter sp.]|jgi:23S rRNA (uracil1939-C5)-methyltransferase|uniref:23S rRNA (Uracil-C(5))-methyltransferase RlmCD n=1 Tax=Candidatus Atribacter allofermentans TaxID=1852833 RepID=A0A1V5T211_9BACT|nr:MAG: 23S rRNA (uracil-C(5))-methyltransferase RlmCD [Candidatus Atribacteria bacterium ADurb.Bin276]
MLKKGDVIEGIVETFALPDCVGVIRHQNWVVFVPGVLPGEKCRVTIRKVKRNFLQGELEEFIEKSPARIEPICPHFKMGCGGCSLQFADYAEQVSIKEKNALNTIEKIGKVDLSSIDYEGFLPSVLSLGYRNKMEFNFGNQDGKLICGLRPKGKYWDLIDLQTCYLMNSQLVTGLLDFFRSYGNRYGLKGYDPVRKDGFLRNLLIRYNRSLDQYLIGLSTIRGELPGVGELVKDLTHYFPNVSGLVHIINNSPANALLFEEKILLYGSDYYIETIGSTQYKVSIDSFFQVNIHTGELLFPIITNYADLQPGESLFDLYSGNGSIGLYLSRQGTMITGIEENPQAVEDAQYNATLNSISSYNAICGRVEKALLDVIGNSMKKGIVDPPRAGLTPKVIKTLVAAHPEKIVYVSCNTASLARDLVVFAEDNYFLKKISWIDLFPQTPHYEAVALIEPSS